MRTDNKVIRQVYPLSRAHLAQSQLRIVAPDIQVRQPESKYDNIRLFWQQTHHILLEHHLLLPAAHLLCIGETDLRKAGQS